MRFTVGTHNLHDEAGVPTFFADVLFFTEAVASTIRKRARALAARTRGRLTHRIVRSPENKSVVIAVRRSVIKVTSKQWFRAHGGVAGITPSRGVLLVRGVVRATGEEISLIDEHRINNSWKRHARFLKLRRILWRKHTDLTERIIAREHAAGRRIVAGGDLNTIRSMSGYEGLKEAGHHLDRLGVSPELRLSNVEVLSRSGSDHSRLRALVRG